MSLYKMEKINDRCAVFLRIGLNNKLDDDWITGYVEVTDEEKERLDGCLSVDITYNGDGCVGVDTMHAYNEKQSLTEKYEDARRQIERILLWLE